MENNLTILNYEGINVIDSREVSEMVGKRHDNLIRDIKKYIEVILTNSKLRALDFFIEDSYEDSKGELRTCYLLTKKGCEMVANKMTGEKGILFTAEYVQAFNQMEQVIKAPKQLTAIERLKLQDEAILEINEKVDNLEGNMPLFKAECDELQDLVHKVGVRYLGGKKSKAYNDASLRGRVYADIQHQLKREFGVNKYAWIKHSQFNKAKEIISNYTLPIVLEDEIALINNQLEMEVTNEKETN